MGGTEGAAGVMSGTEGAAGVMGAAWWRLQLCGLYVLHRTGEIVCVEGGDGELYCVVCYSGLGMPIRSVF